MFVPAKHEIVAFWDWFSTKEGLFRNLVDGHGNALLVDELNSRVIGLGNPEFMPRLNWELGRGASKAYQFAISPTVGANIPIAAEIVRLAPHFGGWEVKLFKQPKYPVVFCYSVEDSNGTLVACDASDWTYVLYEHEERRYSLDLMAKSLPEMNDATRKMLSSLVVEGILGEELMLTRIGPIGLLLAQQVPENRPRTRLSLLGKHMSKLLAGDGG